MPWVNVYVVKGIHRAFGVVGKPLVRWPWVFICISVTIVLAIASVGVPLIEMKTEVEMLGSTSGPGYAAYLVKDEFFRGSSQAAMIIYDFEDGVDALKNLAPICEIQLRLENDEGGLFQKACKKDHEGNCTKNFFKLMYDAFQWRGPKENPAAVKGPDYDCKYLEGALTPSILGGLGKKLELMLGHAVEGSFKGLGGAENIKSAGQIVQQFNLESEFGDDVNWTMEWEHKVFLPEARKLLLASEAPVEDFPNLLRSQQELLYDKAGEKKILKFLNYLGPNSLVDEVTRAVMEDVPLIGGSFLLMFIYCIVMLVRKWKFPIMLQTRLGLACIMMVVATFALTVAYAVQGMLGIPFNALSLSAAFIIYGVGIDDSFVVTDAYARIIRDAPKRKPTESVNEYIEKHVLEAFVETSDAVVLTTLTDCVAFFTGVTIDVIVMQGFCITAGIAVLSVFVLQATFFVPSLVVDERRRLNKRYDLLCCIQTKDHPERKQKRREQRERDNMSVNSAGSNQSRISQVRAMFTAKERFNFLGPIFTVPVASAVVVVFIAVGLFAGSFSWINLKREFDQLTFFPSPSYAKNFVESFIEGKKSQFPLFPEYLCTNVDLDNQRHRQLINRVVHETYNVTNWHIEGDDMACVEECPEVAVESDTASTDCIQCSQHVKVKPDAMSLGVLRYLWDHHPADVQDPSRAPTDVYSGALKKITNVTEWLSLGANEEYRRFFNNTAYLSEHPEVGAAPAYDYTNGRWNVAFSMAMMSVSEFQLRSKHRLQLLEAIAQAKAEFPEAVIIEEGKEPGMDCVVYETLFSQVDRFILTDSYFWSTVGSSIMGVFFVNLLFSQPLQACVSTFIVILVICWILVVFPVSAIDFNTLLVLNLVMAIGFAVDYCAHIGQHFANETHLLPKPRALHAINTMAGSVLKAGFSTILAVSCLVFSGGLVGQTLLKCFLMMVFMGLLHALIFLPAVLFLLASLANYISPPKEGEQSDGHSAASGNHDYGTPPLKANDFSSRPAPVGANPTRKRMTDSIL